eukprot:scaffold2876_cov338-Pavlova_lutheri.AAC.2
MADALVRGICKGVQLVVERAKLAKVCQEDAAELSERVTRLSKLLENPKLIAYFEGDSGQEVLAKTKGLLDDSIKLCSECMDQGYTKRLASSKSLKERFTKLNADICKILQEVQLLCLLQAQAHPGSIAAICADQELLKHFDSDAQKELMRLYVGDVSMKQDVLKKKSELQILEEETNLKLELERRKKEHDFEILKKEREFKEAERKRDMAAKAGRQICPKCGGLMTKSGMCGFTGGNGACCCILTMFCGPFAALYPLCISPAFECDECGVILRKSEINKFKQRSARLSGSISGNSSK